MAMEPHHHHATTLLFLLSIAFSCLHPTVSQATTSTTTLLDGKQFVTYSFPSFAASLLHLPSNLTILGNASISQGALQITPDSSNNADGYLVNQTGRIFFSTPFILWSPGRPASTTVGGKGNYVASFSTVFKFNIFRMNTSLPGEGAAFVVASALDAPPKGSDGGFLGLTNASTDGNATNRFVAVELDTVRQTYDPDDNHVGLNVNGVRSVKTSPLAPIGIQLGPANATNYMVWVDYNGTSRHVLVYMAKEDGGANPKPASPVLDAPLDLSAVVAEKVYFGFSASTGTRFQLNCVLMWNITVEVLDDSSSGRPRWKLWLAISVPCGVMALAAGVLLAGLCIRNRRRKVGDEAGSVFKNTSINLRCLPGIPKEFDYTDLRKGTEDFDERNKLGQGSYGVVYKATVAGDNGESVEVAVKQFPAANTKGQEDFLAELSIINRLRHRNLVRLLGWCHQNGVLLLVYDYMPNGSLDKHLFGVPLGAPVLSWKQRYNIAAGVALALNYLHHEYDQMVIHRDIKPSNIMLDSAFCARLGDFGLARALESDKTSYTEIMGVPGTMGYIAPECFHTGSATRESDVFGLGAVLLVVVCGRRVSCDADDPSACSRLLEWVWRPHGAGRVLEAVDPRLAGEFDEDDAERLLLLGLACSHPNPGARPRTQVVVQALTRALPAPTVPLSKPAFVWPALPVLDGADDSELSLTYSGTTSGELISTYYASSSSSTSACIQNQATSSVDAMADQKDVSTG